MNTVDRQNRDMTPVLMNAKIQHTRKKLKEAMRTMNQLLKMEPDDNLRTLMLDMGSVCDELENRSIILKDNCKGGVCSTGAYIVHEGKGY